MDELFDRIAAGNATFWRDVYETFMDRDMTRAELRHLISRGLTVAEGSYRDLLKVFRLPASDYKRLLNFLVRHGCAVDFRPFRAKNAGGSGGTNVVPHAFGNHAGIRN
jgi:hypothetical protein